MPDAMDRFLTVNDSPASLGRNDPQKSDFSDDSPALDASSEEFESTNAAAAGSQGPCLYLGPLGQRCARPALEGGFCAQHAPRTTKKASSGRGLPQIVGAGIGILAAMWPILFDVVRSIIRWMHSH
jgi:hypothetical protein